VKAPCAPSSTKVPPSESFFAPRTGLEAALVNIPQPI